MRELTVDYRKRIRRIILEDELKKRRKKKDCPPPVEEGKEVDYLAVSEWWERMRQK